MSVGESAWDARACASEVRQHASSSARESRGRERVPDGNERECSALRPLLLGEGPHADADALFRSSSTAETTWRTHASSLDAWVCAEPNRASALDTALEFVNWCPPRSAGSSCGASPADQDAGPPLIEIILIVLDARDDETAASSLVRLSSLIDDSPRAWARPRGTRVWVWFVGVPFASFAHAAMHLAGLVGEGSATVLGGMAFPVVPLGTATMSPPSESTMPFTLASASAIADLVTHTFLLWAFAESGVLGS